MIVSRSLNITTTENTLTVYNVTSSDVGTYTCNASNVIGSATDFEILSVTSMLRYVCTSYAIFNHIRIAKYIDNEFFYLHVRNNRYYHN